MTGTNRLSQIPERLRTTGTRIKDGNRLPDNSPSRHKPGVRVAWTGGAVRREERKGFRMAGEQNVETAKRGYAAFSAGDAVAAMEVLADDIEWITPGNSAISGTLHGKQAVGALWGQLAEKGFTTNPQFWFSDAEHVVVLTHIAVEGGEADSCDVFTFRDGKVVKFQTAGDTALLERVFGSK
jgi:uncharacterized protein